MLEKVALGYAPMIDRKFAVIATRLSLFVLEQYSYADLQVAELLAAVAEVWPKGRGVACLNLNSAELLRGLLVNAPPVHVIIEVPSAIASDRENTAALLKLRATGNRLFLQGRPHTSLPKEVLPCFTWSIISVEEDRRLTKESAAAPVGITRSVGFVQSGVRTMDELKGSFDRGAKAVLGWPMEGNAQSFNNSSRPALQVIAEVMRLVDTEQPPEKIEAAIRHDPSLSFRLMKYINSAAFGSRHEVKSFSHAVLLMGYKRLKRWLALLLATASKDAQMNPIMFAAVRRGMLMEEVSREAKLPPLVTRDEAGSEAFMCGVFSLLDKMMGENFDTLMADLPVPSRVKLALVDGSGPYAPYLQLVRAVEDGQPELISVAAANLGIDVAMANRSILTALSLATQLGD